MPIPEGRHDDWIWPFSLIPRRWTAFESSIPPVKIFGNAEGHLDIPTVPGTWAIAGLGNLKIPVHFAWRTKSNWLIAFGFFRFDYLDGYYNCPRFTVKHYR